jgi:serine/threonine protein kinase
MTPERWRQVEEILQAVIDRPRHERSLLLDQSCAGDDELKKEAASLLRAFDESGEFIEQPAVTNDARVLAGILRDANIGRVIGHYKIIERLGAGGMGEVYLAQDTRLSRRVALKILPASFVFDHDRLHRFQREARAASALNHPNIFTIHEVGEIDGVHFIATEFIDGQTLSELSLSRTLTFKEIVEIAVQIATALEAAHAAGIVHRDIKPENIMLRGDGIIKILDFGIAKLTEQTSESSSDTPVIARSQTETGVVLGTPRYMSPEQARGFPVDERTDIWSFGVVLYEMIAHRSPFESATRMDTLVAILEREPPPLDQFVDKSSGSNLLFQEIVNKTLRKERSDRYQTATEMLAALNDVKERFDIAALTNRLDMVDSEQVVSVTQKRRTALPILIVSAVLLAVVTGTLLYKRFVLTRDTNVPVASSDDGTNAKLYSNMNQAEQLAFIRDQEQRVSSMMGERPVELNNEALLAIKERLDRYVARTGSKSSEPGREDLRVIYNRAIPFIPLITRSFTARKVPAIVGIYLPMVESEYKTCFENQTGAKGLFQFLPQTAKAYGVSHEEMCDVDKMTPAAAHYIADRMAELGDDSQSMTLVLLSYNIGAEGVRNALRELRDSDDYERNFWTLFANRNTLQERFRQEGAFYVPTFFAAAIIGENPRAFGLETPPLSSLIQPSLGTTVGKGSSDVWAIAVGKGGK